MRERDTSKPTSLRALPDIDAGASITVTQAEPSAEHIARVRSQARHDLYGWLALLSAVIWTLGTFLLFITFAAGNPRPIPSAAMSMTVPLVLAALPWILYRPLSTWLMRRRLRAHRPDAAPAGREAQG